MAAGRAIKSSEMKRRVSARRSSQSFMALRMTTCTSPIPCSLRTRSKTAFPGHYRKARTAKT